MLRLCLGRFISEDPIGLLGGDANLYAYCANDPVNFTDPLGLWRLSAFGMEFEFDSETVGNGLATGLHGAMSGATFGLYSGGAYRCQEGFNVSFGLGMGASMVGGYAVNASGAALAFGRGLAWAGSRLAMMGRGRAFAAGGAAAAATQCFPMGTLVVMEDGTLKPIEQVREGEEVMSRNPYTGATEAKQVAGTTVREADELVAVTLKTGDKSEVVEATPEHPFFVSGRGWVPAGQLALGNSIVTRAGPNATVTKVERKQHKTDRDQAGGKTSIPVFNLTVEGNHNYFVGNTGGGAWVHNNDCSINQVRIALGRAGMSVRGYAIRRADAVDQASAPKYMDGYMKTNGAGDLILDPRGRPQIILYDKGLSSIENAVATIGHEMQHIKDARAGVQTLREAEAEMAGQAFLQRFLRARGAIK